jgi:two-component system, chemotaxis family, protein-glutamate methylesterase/glutaminase
LDSRHEAPEFHQVLLRRFPMMMKVTQRPIVVVGASAGGKDALSRLVSQFPADFPAAVFVVQHMAPDNTGDILVEALAENGKLGCKLAEDGEPIEAGRIYVAPPDHHMLLEDGKVLVTKGARENRSRPAIDPLFRSAAVTYGTRAIGVLLTGYLDDGTSGLIAIKRCGGTCVVQDPKDAAYPDMPQNALNNLDVDHCLPLASMGELLVSLVRKKPAARVDIPKDIIVEANIAKRVLSDLKSVEAVGDQVPFNCPDCGGVLWKVALGKHIRYRCHTGHAFTSSVLLAEQTKRIEETLWAALRMFEERKNLLMTMTKSAGGTGNRFAIERAKESNVHIKRIRAMLLSGDKAPDDNPRET